MLSTHPRWNGSSNIRWLEVAQDTTELDDTGKNDIEGLVTLKSGCKVEELQLEHVERIETALTFQSDHRLAGALPHHAVPSVPGTPLQPGL